MGWDSLGHKVASEGRSLARLRKEENNNACTDI